MTFWGDQLGQLNTCCLYLPQYAAIMSRNYLKNKQASKTSADLAPIQSALPKCVLQSGHILAQFTTPLPWALSPREHCCLSDTHTEVEFPKPAHIVIL